MRLRFTIRDLLWLTLVVALAVGWWIDSRGHRYGFRWEQTVTSLENRLNAQAAQIEALKAEKATIFSAEEDRISAIKVNNSKLRQELERLESQADH